MDNTDIHVHKSDRPGTYFLPRKQEGSKRHPYELSVTLELCPGWKFDSIYPWTKINALDGIETAQWKVTVDEYGDPVNRSGAEEYHGHLSWETMVNADFRPSPGKNPHFIPALPVLNPTASVVLSRSHVLRSDICGKNYLHQVLAVQLGLPEDIVRDFRDHFEAKFGGCLRNLHARQSIAISFMPQKHIEEAARIRITPQPDATARILMLFGTVDTSQESGSWSAWAGQRHSNVHNALKAKNWAALTGLQPEVLRDKTIFRAIEWGVMRVPEERLIARKDQAVAINRDTQSLDCKIGTLGW